MLAPCRHLPPLSLPASRGLSTSRGTRYGLSAALGTGTSAESYHIDQTLIWLLRARGNPAASQVFPTPAFVVGQVRCLLYRQMAQAGSLLGVTASPTVSDANVL